MMIALLRILCNKKKFNDGLEPAERQRSRRETEKDPNAVSGIR